MEDNAQRLALFPMGAVLLPSMLLPLHIFEQRYRMLIAHCLDNGVPFGVVLSGSNGTRDIGCTARVERVLERYDDGRMDILCLGVTRFRIRSTFNDSAWLSADVDYLDAQNSAAAEGQNDDGLMQLARDTVKQLELYAAIVGGSIDRQALLHLGPHKLSYVAGASSMFSLEQKQSILELDSTAERLGLVRDTLINAIARRRMTRAARRVIGNEENIDHLLN